MASDPETPARDHAARLAAIARRRAAAEAELKALEDEQPEAIAAADDAGMAIRDIADHLDVSSAVVRHAVNRHRNPGKYATREADRKRRLGEYIEQHGMKPMDPPTTEQ